MFSQRTIIFLLFYLLPITYSQANESRVALVIGNADYISSPLKNPSNDAHDMSAKLRSLGFDVVERNNIGMRQIGTTLSEFRSKLKPGTVALVFYAGHGIQIKGENYLPAVDADINTEEDVPNQSIAVKQIMDVLDESKTRLNLVFLDACRNNPYSRSFRSAAGGLARVTAPSGTLISYATRPGSVAADGYGRNGLYTSKLLKQMGSNQQIELSLKVVVSEVKTASLGKQEPWMEGSIEGEFCFAGCGGSSQPLPLPVERPTSEVGPVSFELSFWDSIKNSDNPADFRAYLEQYPKGRFASLARNRLEQSVATVETPAHSAQPADATESASAPITKALELYEQKRYAEAFLLYLPLAEQGNADAQNHIGRMYHDGTGATQDHNQAMNWFKKAAEQGYAKAQANIGVMYANGQGVDQDYKQAVYWNTKAAEQKYAPAQYGMGHFYEYGQGVDQDYNQAVYWYKKAAEQGFADPWVAEAQYCLGFMYDRGHGVAEDHNQAVYWYKKAAEQGNEKAIAMLPN